MKSDNVVLFSGGVDSLTTSLMLKKRGEEFSCLYVDLGHFYNLEERETVIELVDKLKVDLEIFDLKEVGEFEKENAEIEFRNLMLIISALWKGADKVYLSVEQGTSVNESGDRDEEFINWVVTGLSRMSGRKIEVENLVSEFTKEEEERWVIDNYGEKGWKLLLKTFSCYNPVVGRICGECRACLRTYLADVGVGIKRNWEVINPRDSKVFQEYLQKTKEGVYVGKRGEQYKRVFEKLGVW